jgi:Flp pilus assembly protein TadG
MTTKPFSFCRFRRLPIARRKEKGATAVEMAMIAPVFFLFLIGTTELSLMLTVQSLMENAAYNTSRLAKTGYTSTGKTQLQTVQAELNSELGSFGSLIDLTKISMTSVAYASMATSGTGTTGMGTASQVVVYTFTYPWKLFTPMMSAIMGNNGIVTLTSRIVVQNEPY